MVRRAIHLGESVLRRPDVTYEDRAQLGITLRNYGGMVYETDLPEAEEHLRRSIEVFASMRADDPAPRYDHASALASLSAILGAQGRMEEAWPIYADCIDVLEELLAKHPDHTEMRSQYGMVLMNYGTDLDQDHEEQGRELLRRAVAAFDALAEDFPSTPRFASDRARR